MESRRTIPASALPRQANGRHLVKREWTGLYSPSMLIIDRLNIGGSFAEFRPIDLPEGFVLVGHDGPHHVSIAAGKTVLRSLRKYHGKPGSGAGVETRGFFEPDVRTLLRRWVPEGPAHHFALGIGHHADTIAKIAEQLNIEHAIATRD